jgi:hypothetical protein
MPVNPVSKVVDEKGMTKRCEKHRNLTTRTSMFALVQQTFLAKKASKQSADLHPRQGM